MSAPETAAARKPSDLAADLQTLGCPVCNHVVRAARDFFARWQYALSRDTAAQEKFAADLGFCPRHMWQLHKMSSPWGESIGFAALIEAISRRLAGIECDETAGYCVAKIARVEGNCAVCAMLQETQRAYVARLATFVSQPGGAQGYRRSAGVCLRHLGQMLALVSRPVREFLLSAASDRFAQVAQQMRAYAAKREAIRRDLITADEESASLRALIHIAGAREYSVP